MKLDPGFPWHWKTERLIDELGADGVVALLRLWGQCQIKREWKGLKMTPKRLSMETKWKGDENHLFRVFTDPDAAWLDLDEDGTFSLHGFEEHQKQVIHLWSAGAKGGRPKKDSPTPPLKKEEDTSSSSYSSSYPICKPNGLPNENQMVSNETKRGAKSDNLPTNPHALKIAELFRRKPTTPWSVKEIKAFKAIPREALEELETVCRYTRSEMDKGNNGRHRRDLMTFLNNYQGELDRARQQQPATHSAPKQYQFIED